MGHEVALFLNHFTGMWRTYVTNMTSAELIWLGVGIVGQSVFMLRFVVQWIHSERHKKSSIPISFWYLSLVGGWIVLAYGLHKAEPIIVIGQVTGIAIYARNLALIHRRKRDIVTPLPEENAS